MRRRLPRMSMRTCCAAVLLQGAFVTAVYAGDSPSPADAGQAVAAPLDTPSAPALAGCRCVPAGTPVRLEIAEALVSDERKPGDGFALRLAEAVSVDGVVLVPAGTPGRGEVVHAAKARGGGQPGELTLAARYLEIDGRRIPLRGMKFGAAGADRAGAALATALAVGVFAQFIHGGEVRIPPGTTATAKLAVDVDAATPAPSVGTAAPSDGISIPNAPEPATKSLTE